MPFQDAAIALTGQRIGGWKVGRVNPPIDGTVRLAGPIFADRIVAPDDKNPVMSIFSDGFGAAEAEFLLRIGTPPAAGQTRFTRDEAKTLIDAVHIGIEVASSPFPEINKHGAPVTVSDFGNNNGLVIGAPIAGWRDDAFESWPVELRINGEVAGRGQAVDMLDGAIGAARFLFEAMAERGIALEAGQWDFERRGDRGSSRQAGRRGGGAVRWAKERDLHDRCGVMMDSARVDSGCGSGPLPRPATQCDYPMGGRAGEWAGTA